MKTYALGGECGVIVHSEQSRVPYVNELMPPHACYRAASNVRCAVVTVQSAPKKPSYQSTEEGR